MNPNKVHAFTALIEGDPEGTQAAFVTIPFDVKEVFGTSGMVKIHATFDGHPYRGVIANMGSGCHVLGIRKDIRKALAKTIGDKIKVTLQQDFLERTITVPVEISSLLKKNTKAKSFFDSLSYTNRKEYVVWITSAKREETKEKRMSQILKKLSAGKKNPSEK